MHVPQAKVEDLADRLARTRWPHVVTVQYGLQGPPSGRVLALAERWGGGATTGVTRKRSPAAGESMCTIWNRHRAKSGGSQRARPRLVQPAWPAPPPPVRGPKRPNPVYPVPANGSCWPKLLCRQLLFADASFDCHGSDYNGCAHPRRDRTMVDSASIADRSAVAPGNKNSLPNRVRPGPVPYRSPRRVAGRGSPAARAAHRAQPSGRS
jgi:hypothetical protein